MKCRLGGSSGKDAVYAAGKKAAAIDSNGRRTVDDMKNLIDGAREAHRGRWAGRNDGAWRSQVSGQRQ